MKKILFIGINYYDYTKEIIKHIEKEEYRVTYYPLRLMDTLSRVQHTLTPQLFQKKQDRYHEEIMEKEKNNNYDIILFIQVHDMSLKILIKLKDMHSEARFVLYNWDSVKTHDYRKYIPYFHKVFTFDYQDAEDYNLVYLPLFGIEKYTQKQVVKNKIVYFVGNVCHTHRFITLMAFIKYCQKNNIEFRYHICCSPVTVCKLLCAGIIPRHFSFYRASDLKMRYLLEAFIVFDCRNHEQNGYTMRIIENLCSGRKIITDNSHIELEPFYSKERIFVYQDLNFEGVKNFIDSERDFIGNCPGLHIGAFVHNLLA